MTTKDEIFSEWVEKHYVPYDPKGGGTERRQFVQGYLSRAGMSKIKCLNCGRDWGAHSGVGCMGVDRGNFFLLPIDLDSNLKMDPNMLFKIRSRGA